MVVTTNLNGDYLSDAFAALVGGIGVSPGANINYEQGWGLFEANHGSAEDIAGQDKANPSSLILSGAMMFDFLEWHEAAALIRRDSKRRSGAETSRSICTPNYQAAALSAPLNFPRSSSTTWNRKKSMVMMNDFAPLKRSLTAQNQTFQYFSIPDLQKQGIGNPEKMPYCMRILLEGMLRNCGNKGFTKEHVLALLQNDHATPSMILFQPTASFCRILPASRF